MLANDALRLYGVHGRWSKTTHQQSPIDGVQESGDGQAHVCPAPAIFGPTRVSGLVVADVWYAYLNRGFSSTTSANCSAVYFSLIAASDMDLIDTSDLPCRYVSTKLPVNLFQGEVSCFRDKEVTTNNRQSSKRAVYKAKLTSQASVLAILQVRVSKAYSPSASQRQSRCFVEGRQETYSVTSLMVYARRNVCSRNASEGTSAAMRYVRGAHPRE